MWRRWGQASATNTTSATAGRMSYSSRLRPRPNSAGHARHAPPTTRRGGRRGEGGQEAQPDVHPHAGGVAGGAFPPPPTPTPPPPRPAPPPPPHKAPPMTFRPLPPTGGGVVPRKQT